MPSVTMRQAGRHNEKRESYGHSLIIDPWGKVVARLEDPLATGIAVADVDLAYLEEVCMLYVMYVNECVSSAALWTGKKAW